MPRRLSPEADLLRVLRGAQVPLPRADLYEQIRSIDDIAEMDRELKRLVRADRVRADGTAPAITYSLATSS